MLSKRWPTEKELDRCLILAGNWIEQQHLAGKQAWPVSASGNEASLWGGTVDAVCAIAALRHCRPRVAADIDDVELGAVKDWIKTQQMKNGSYYSGEFAFAGAEPTAWALVALHAIAPDDTKGREVTAALSYLESCIDVRDGSVSSTHDSGDLPRTMPSALTLWAFALWRHRSDLRDKIVSYLLRSQDNSSHGWGVTSASRANAATTAQVLVALQAARVPPSTFELAVEYVIGQQRKDGRWPDSVDEWRTAHERTAQQLIHKCTNSGTAWCLLALAQLKDHRSRTASVHAVGHLIRTQTKTGTLRELGSWMLSDDGAHRHVWLTGQIVVAIATWRCELPPRGPRLEGLRLANGLMGVVEFLLSRAPVISMIGVLGAVVALAIDTADTGLRDQLVGDGVTFRQSLLTSGLATAMLGAISWIYRSARKSHLKRREQ